MHGTEFRLLGPVGIWQGELGLGPTAAQQRSVLAMLLLEPGRVVSVDRLVMAVWGEDPPGSARNAVQVQISKLRRILAALPDTELSTSAQGYCLTVDQERVDLHRFRELVREARTVGDGPAGELLYAALQLWRGPALADVAGGWLPETVGAGLEEERRAVVEECAAIDLRSGRHQEAAAVLSPLVAEHPLRERSVGLLMEALSRSGRRADALALFRGTRQRYVDELGIEPGDDLQRLHRQVLDAQSGAGAGARPAGVAPAAADLTSAVPSTGVAPSAGTAPAAGAADAAYPAGAVPAAVSAPAAHPTSAAAPAAAHPSPTPDPDPAPDPAAANRATPAPAPSPSQDTSPEPSPAPPSESPPPSHSPPAAGVAVPQQLPADVAHFTGRDRELAGLDALLRPAPGTGTGATAGRAPTAAVISVIAGSGGLGKTTLAVHWAHRVRDRFPDGQLYVNLRGFGPTGSAMTPSEAVRGFLDAFQVPAHRIPATVEAQTALYRSLLVGRRVLILLDNARDADQVRPLLPGAPGCLVLLTSRNELTGLVVAEQAQPLPLDLLDRAEARELLARRLGSERVAAEPDAVEDVITVCAGLPLALAIVAARAATHPRFSLEALARELHDARGSLDAFDGGDATTDVRAVFSWSYHTLGTAAARLFRLLGVHPGPDISAAAVASLMGLPVPQARRLLLQLTRAHLLTERSPGQYALHDLLRAYATELAEAYDSEDDRRAALHRTLDHYLHTAVAAGRVFTPQRTPLTLPAAQPGVCTESFADYGEALTWFTAEHHVLVAAQQQAAESGFETHAWQLAWSLAEFLDQLGHWHDQGVVHTVALDAARRTDCLAGQAHAHHGLGLADLRMAQYDRARDHLMCALDLHGKTGNPAGQALIHVALNLAGERQGRHEEGLYHAQRTLELYREVGQRSGEAYALNNVGWAYAMVGQYQQTLVHCEKALRMLQQAHDGRGASAAWDSLGYAHHRLGDHEQAIVCYRNAVELRRERGERVRAAETMYRLGSAQLAAGDVPGARDTWRQALTMFDALGHPDAGRVREELDRLG
ncbi:MULTISPECIES: BTAD domain-containing putative transcriptional regulator [unclassified Streptomyces]|uniref:AfsR/SARP family transcriptional regulator n=1 Tax=unclassified Streptomyces TaxID=2593676 RepID=UPI00336A8F0A